MYFQYSRKICNFKNYGEKYDEKVEGNIYVVSNDYQKISKKEREREKPIIKRERKSIKEKKFEKYRNKKKRERDLT